MESSLVDLIGLPEYPFTVFERTPLVLALCQIRFTPVLGIADPAFVAPFQRAIQERYPLAAQAEEVGLHLDVASGALEVRQEQQRRQRWQFTDPTENWTVVLAQDFLALETRAYERFSDFLERLSQLVDALVTHVQPRLGLRVGLRYINEIRSEQLSWEEVIRPELLGILATQEFRRSVAQTTQQVVLRYEHEQGINLNHGLLPGGTTVRPRQGEQPPEQPFYLFDIDAYRVFPLPSGLSMDHSVICEQVERFNRAIYRVFRWSVTDAYLATLGVREHADR